MPTPKPTKEELAQLKLSHPRAQVFEVEEHDLTFVLRGANRAEYEMFKTAVQLADKAPQKSAKAVENLVKACTLFPARDALESLGEELPAIFDSLGEKVLALSGMTKDLQKKSV